MRAHTALPRKLRVELGSGRRTITPATWQGMCIGLKIFVKQHTFSFTVGSFPFPSIRD